MWFIPSYRPGSLFRDEKPLAYRLTASGGPRGGEYSMCGSLNNFRSNAGVAGCDVKVRRRQLRNALDAQFLRIRLRPMLPVRLGVKFKRSVLSFDALMNDAFTYMYWWMMHLLICIDEWCIYLYVLMNDAFTYMYWWMMHLLICIDEWCIYLYVLMNDAFTYMYWWMMHLLTCIDEWCIYLYVLMNDTFTYMY